MRERTKVLISRRLLFVAAFAVALTSQALAQQAPAASQGGRGGGARATRPPLFGGDANGRFKAFDDKSGKVLWEINLGAPVSGFPVTFAVNGKQYVAVTTGSSLVAGSTGRMTPELQPSNAANVFVFALP